MSQAGIPCLAFMILIGCLSFFLPPEAVAISISIVVLFAGPYFLYYLFKHNLHHDIIRGFLLSLLVMALGMIPVLGWIAIIGFLIYNIARAVDGLKSLVPDALVSIVIYALLCARVMFDIHTPLAIAGLAFAYLAVAVLYCRTLDHLEPELAWFKLSIMFLAIPFCVLTVVSIVSALGNLFRTVGSSLTRTLITPQTVSGHMRNGMRIDAYTRNITTTVTTTVTHTVPSVGTITATAAADVAQKVKDEQAD